MKKSLANEIAEKDIKDKMVKDNAFELLETAKEALEYIQNNIDEEDVVINAFLGTDSESYKIIYKLKNVIAKAEGR